MNKFIFIVSTSGSVLSKLFEHELVLENTEVVVSDRFCGAIEVAKSFGVNQKVLSARTGEEFSVQLNQQVECADACFITFYTKILTDPFLGRHVGKIFNCHPSILPIGQGLNGFKDTLASNSLFMGCTLHEVKDKVDSGMAVIQAAIPLNRGLAFSFNRHKIFLAQYYSTLQFIDWVLSKRLSFDDYWKIEGASYRASVFSPNLDIDFFDKFNIVNEL